MGFKRQKTFLLEFEGEEFEGLEVRTRGASVAGVLGVLDVAALLGGKGEGLTGLLRGQVDRLFRALAGCPTACSATHLELAEVGLEHYENRIVSWNLEGEDGRPVPADYRGLVDQDFDFASALAYAWLDGVLGTPGPLAPTSNDGGPPGAESIPMAALSPGLLS